MALLNQTDLEAKLGRPLTTEETSAFSTINVANQTFVEKMIGSSLETATEATRYYDGGVQHLAIDPCTDVSAVKIVNTDLSLVETVDSDYYVTDPTNLTLKTMIRNRYGRFTRGMNNVGVTALFSIAGDAGVLAIVKSALLDALVSEIDNSDNIVKESIEGYSVEMAQSETRDALMSIKYLFPEVL